MNLSEVFYVLPFVFKSRVEPPEMGMIIPKVGRAEGWLFGVWVSCFGGGPGGGGRSCSGFGLRPEVG